MPRATLPATPIIGPRPDLTGFQKAQARLRTVMGRDAVFRIPQNPVWPSGTPLDPQTGRPYDPTVEPESGGGHISLTRRISLVFRPIRVNVEDPLGDDERGGLRHSDSIAFTVSEDDYIDVKDATEIRVGEIDFKITKMEKDAGIDARYIGFGEAK